MDLQLRKFPFRVTTLQHVFQGNKHKKIRQMQGIKFRKWASFSFFAEINFINSRKISE